MRPIPRSTRPRPTRPLPRLVAVLALVSAGLAIQATTATDLSAQLDPTDTRSQELRPGDMIRLQVWRQPEFSGDFFVTDDGFIGHPLLRAIYAIRRPISDVEESVRLFLTEFESEPNFVMEPFFRVAVGGQVRQPSVHPLRPGTTVAEAVAIAGGVTEQGRLDRILLRRAGEEFAIDLTDAEGTSRLTTIRSGDEIVVRERKSFFRNYFLPALSAVGSMVTIAWGIDRIQG